SRSCTELCAFMAEERPRCERAYYEHAYYAGQTTLAERASPATATFPRKILRGQERAARTAPPKGSKAGQMWATMRQPHRSRVRCMLSLRRVCPFFLGALLPLLAACSGELPSANYPFEKEYDPRKHEFVIGTSDELRVTVWKMPDLSNEV